MVFSGTNLPAMTAPPRRTSRAKLFGAGGQRRKASFRQASRNGRGETVAMVISSGLLKDERISCFNLAMALGFWRRRV
ncbi:hypothetical protein VTK26DRAFT_784 [Humicola hyalothermophila]